MQILRITSTSNGVPTIFVPLFSIVLFSIIKVNKI